MMANIFGLVLLVIAAVSASPEDPIIRKYGDGPRYQHMTDDSGEVHLVDSWLKASDLVRAARYNADAENVYYLYTRENPSIGDPIVLNDTDALNSSYFDAEKNIVFIIHGWTNNATSPVNTVLWPAFLEADDVNVFVVDWSVGADDDNYFVAVINTITSGEAVARFINWLNEETGATPEQYHIVGHSLGGQQAGIVGRNVNGDIAYITACDPAGPGWEGNIYRFQATDGVYTEVIHTNAGFEGYPQSIGDVDFYPNGGTFMPGCNVTISCNHARSFYYLAESVVSGGFTGVECLSYLEAFVGLCTLNGTLNMGGITAKTGSTGVYYLTTNAESPFSQG